MVFSRLPCLGLGVRGCTRRPHAASGLRTSEGISTQRPVLWGDRRRGRTALPRDPAAITLTPPITVEFRSVSHTRGHGLQSASLTGTGAVHRLSPWNVGAFHKPPFLGVCFTLGRGRSWSAALCPPAGPGRGGRALPVPARSADPRVQSGRFPRR